MAKKDVWNWREHFLFSNRSPTSLNSQKKLSESEYDALIKKQFWELFESLNLDITDDAKLVLLPQSVLGRILNGHGMFAGYAREDITMTRIISALDMDPKTVRGVRQKMVDGFRWCVDNLLDGKLKYLIDEFGEPVYGVNFLRNFELDCDKEMFKGGVIIGRMDNIEWRLKTQAYYQKTLGKKDFRIAGGKEFPVNMDVMKKLGFNQKILSEGEYSIDDINYFMNIGLIPKEESLVGLDGIENMYLRYIRGSGVCDDASLTTIGKRKGLSSMFLGFGIDTTDTYSKYIQEVRVGGVDEFIGEHIMKRWREKYNEELVSDEECMEVIYFGAKNNFPKIDFSSSHRRFVEIEEGSDQPTFLNHVNFLKSGRYPKGCRFGFERERSENFYRAIDQRFKIGGLGSVINNPCSNYMPGKGHRN